MSFGPAPGRMTRTMCGQRTAIVTTRTFDIRHTDFELLSLLEGFIYQGRRGGLRLGDKNTIDLLTQTERGLSQEPGGGWPRGVRRVSDQAAVLAGSYRANGRRSCARPASCALSTAVSIP